MLLLAFGQSTLPAAQQQEVIKEVKFQSATRGGSENISITADSVFVEKKGLAGTVHHKAAIGAADWQKVLESLRDVKLAEIAQLPAPTQLRQRDAAMHSTISIITDQKTYTSSTFDNHNSPKPLNPLMKIIEHVSAQ